MRCKERTCCDLNPSQLANTILISQKEAGNVNIRLFNAEGRFVKQVANENLSKGSHKFDVNIQDTASGIYYYKITLGNSNTYHLKFIKI
ncbi:MAG: T9SS type A sorting domain-containing protein [Chitinophagales bacterium]|nr:T9SS type A sorting domain-containing protein [Chitinophagales bacterium]